MLCKSISLKIQIFNRNIGIDIKTEDIETFYRERGDLRGMVMVGLGLDTKRILELILKEGVVEAKRLVGIKGVRKGRWTEGPSSYGKKKDKPTPSLQVDI